MAQYVLSSGAETNEKTEFRNYGAITFSTTNPKTGTYVHVLNYVTDGNGDRNAHLQWTVLPSYRNWSAHLQLRLEGTPSDDVVIMNDGPTDTATGDVIVRVDTARKIKVTTSSGSTTGTTVLNTAQYYQIEVRADKTGNARVYVRIDEVDELDRAVGSTARTEFTFGELNKDNPPSAAVTFRMDDMHLLVTTAGENPPWWNTTTPHYRTYDAGGNYNDFTGSPEATNKYLNIDDYSTSDADTTYNQGGAKDTVKTQTHNPVDATPTGTLKGFNIYGRHKANVFDLNYLVSTNNKFLIRDNGVDYTKDFILNDANYNTIHDGYRNRPDGTTLTAVALNAIEAGCQNNLTNTVTWSVSPLTLEVSPTNQRFFPTGDSAVDDGSWTLVGGTAGSAYTTVDDNETAEYIHHNATAVKQGFTRSSIGTVNGIILSVAISARMGAVSDTGVNNVRAYYKSGGVYYFTGNSPDIAAGTARHIIGSFDTNPATNVAWVAGDISSGEWGIEIVTLNATRIEVYTYEIHLAIRSFLRETSYWMVTAHGDAYTEVGRVNDFNIVQLNQAVNRASTY